MAHTESQPTKMSTENSFPTIHICHTTSVCFLCGKISDDLYDILGNKQTPEFLMSYFRIKVILGKVCGECQKTFAMIKALIDDLRGKVKEQMNASSCKVIQEVNTFLLSLLIV